MAAAARPRHSDSVGLGSAWRTVAAFRLRGRAVSFVDDTQQLGLHELRGLEVLVLHFHLARDAAVERFGERSEHAGPRSQRLPTLGADPTLDGFACPLDRVAQCPQLRLVLAEVAVGHEQRLHGARDVADLTPSLAPRGLG